MGRLRQLIRGKNGTLNIEILIGMLVVTVLVILSANFFDLIIKHQNISYTAKAIAKTIELEGAVNDMAYNQLDALNKSFNTQASMKVSDVTYFNSFDKTIQFRDTFTVTVQDTFDFVILTPLFTDPLVLHVPMKSDIPGKSEVYWKVD